MVLPGTYMGFVGGRFSMEAWVIGFEYNSVEYLEGGLKASGLGRVFWHLLIMTHIR